MAEVLLFHHAQGLTAGVRSFADELRAAGHVVHTPDLYDGQTFPTIDDGVKHAKSVGFGTILDRGVAASEGLPDHLVYAGFSLGVMPAQKLAQTRRGAKGALLFSACFPPSEFDGPWPDRVPLQVHLLEDDGWVKEGDLDAARDLAASQPDAELFLYPGERHLFADKSLSEYDADAAAQLMTRVLSFLGRIKL